MNYSFNLKLDYRSKWEKIYMLKLTDVRPVVLLVDNNEFEEIQS